MTPIKVKRRPGDANSISRSKNGSQRMSGTGETIIHKGRAYSFKSEKSKKKKERKAMRISSRMRSSLPNFNMYRTMSSVDEKTNYTSIDTESDRSVIFQKFRISFLKFQLTIQWT